MRTIALALLLLAACSGGGAGSPEYDERVEFCSFTKWVPTLGDHAYFHGFIIFANDGLIELMRTDFGEEIAEEFWQTFIDNHRQQIDPAFEPCITEAGEWRGWWWYVYSRDDFFFNP